MKLLLEASNLLIGYTEDEINESSGQTERNYYLSGICTTPGVKNRNGRTYPRNIWEREVTNYQKEIREKTINTLGEYQHPPRSTVDPMKAVIRITELSFKDDGNVWIKAKILNDNSEQTNKLKGLIKEGIKIGISTRGVGKVSATGIVEDFKLITADIVDMPSDYNAMLNGVVEGYKVINGTLQEKEFYIDENGCVGECSLDYVVENKVYKNVDVFKSLLSEKNAEKLCDLKLDEKEELLGKFLGTKQNINEDFISSKELEYEDYIGDIIAEKEIKYQLYVEEFFGTKKATLSENDATSLIKIMRENRRNK